MNMIFFVLTHTLNFMCTTEFETHSLINEAVELENVKLFFSYF